MNDQGAMTDAEWWDDKWRLSKVKPVGPRHHYFGRNGLFLDAMRRRLPDLDNKSVLELGGAYSRFLLAFAKWCNAEATAVDFSPVGLEMTRRMFAANGLEVNAVLADFVAWDGGGKKFDLVTHWGVLEHFEDPKIILAKSAELLAPGGAMLFSMPNLEAYATHFWKRWSPDSWSKHIFHSDEAIRQACRATGLRLDEAFYFGLPMIGWSYWERPGIPQKLVSGAELAMHLVAMSVPLPLFRGGTRRIASMRGFVVRRA